MGEDFFEGKGVRTARKQGAIDALAKIKDKTWTSMEKAFKSVNEVVKSGGFGALMGGTTEQIKQQVKTSVTGLFSPVTNEINSFVANLLSETGINDAVSKVSNSFGNLVNTMTAPDTGLGKAVNFIGDAVANTLDFAAKGWESLLTGRNAFIQEIQYFTAEQLAHIEAGRGTTLVASEFSDIALEDFSDLDLSGFF